jgi:hypothetical protein
LKIMGQRPEVKVQGLEVWVWGMGFGVRGLRLWVWGLGFRV